MYVLIQVFAFVFPIATFFAAIVYSQKIGLSIGCVPATPNCKVNSELWGPRLAVVGLGVGVASYFFVKRASIVHPSLRNRFGQYGDLLFIYSLLIIAYILFSLFLAGKIKELIDGGEDEESQSVKKLRNLVNSIAFGLFVTIEAIAIWAVFNAD